MNDKFSEVLKSLQQKNETVEKEKVAKQSPKEGQHSDDVVDFEGHSNPISPHFVLKKTEEMQSRQECDPSDNVVDNAGPTSTDSVVKETDKPIEMEEDKANQAASHLKNGEQHVKDEQTQSGARKIFTEAKKRDCGVFIVVYTDYLSEGLGISYSSIGASYHHLRYATLLCKYKSEKEENGYFSENDDLPRPRSKFAPKEIDRGLHIK
ncbi:hypothetical protein BC332_30103 [Capsicum chinense]|nr:hypothetical protein BC332_30103 [Capsicum chinense]